MKNLSRKISLLLLGTASLLILYGCGTAHGDADAAAMPPPAKVSLAADAGLFTVEHPEQFPLATAEAHAAAHGYPRRGEHINALDVEQSWRDRFRLLKEAALENIAGTAVTLIQIEPTRREAAHL